MTSRNLSVAELYSVIFILLLRLAFQPCPNADLARLWTCDPRYLDEIISLWVEANTGGIHSSAAVVLDIVLTTDWWTYRLFTLRTCHSLLKTLWSRRVQSRSLPETVCAALFTLGRRLNPTVHLQWFPLWNAIQWKPFHWTEEEVNAALADENSRMLETRVTEGTSSHWTEEEVNAALVDENSRMLATPVTKRSRPRSPGPISPNTERRFFALCAADPQGVAEPESLDDSPHTKKLKRWYQCEIHVSDEEGVPEMPESSYVECPGVDLSAPSSSSGPAPASSKPTYKWGTCLVCSRAMHPCCPSTGLHAGQYRIRCNNFNKFVNGKRMCWNSAPYVGPIEDLPKMVRSKRASLLGDLSFQFRQG